MHHIRFSFSGMTIGLMVILLCGHSFSTQAADGQILLYESHFAAKGLQWEEMDDGTHRLNLVDGRRLGVTGEPDLPALDLLFLVPSEVAFAGVLVEPLSVRRESLPGPLAAAAPIMTSTGEMASQRHLAPVDGVFPEGWGSFEGLHSWHGYRLLAVTVYPVRLHDGDDQNESYLEFLEHFAIHALTDSNVELPLPLTRMRKVPGERQRLEITLRQMVANPAALSGYVRAEGIILDKQGGPHLPTPNPSLEGSGVRFLIVTNADLSAEFQSLADHRTAMGLPAKVVTREWIEATQRHGIDFQETLRMYLQEAYSKWGVEYLLLGGDTSVIPTRYVRSTFYGPQGITILPTDRYYACLDGNWNANGNGWLGETSTQIRPGDDADLAPELAIGRVPVRTPQGVQAFIDKVIAYESAQPDAPFTNRVLLAAEELFSYLDGADLADELNNDIIQPCSDLDVLRMYATGNGDMHLNLANFIAQANTGDYGQICHFGHAHYYNMSMNNQNFGNNHADAMTNAPGFFLLYGLNCSSAAYDVSCISGRLVSNPQGGSIVSIGSAREAFPFNAFAYKKTFYENMICNTMLRTGDAINAALMQYIGHTHSNTTFRWTNLNMVILGDPSVSIWNAAPVLPQISAPEVISTGEQTIQVTVSADGAPAIGADVCFAKDDETYAWATTDISGNAWLDVIPKTSGTMTLTVSGKGLGWTTEEIAVTGSSTYVSLKEILVSDTAGNDNGLPEAGETLSLQLEFQDLGGGGASGLNVSVTSAHPDLAVLSGSSPVPDIPPGGGTVFAVEPIVVQTPAATRDGTSVHLRVEVTASGGGSWVSRGEIEILAPEAEMVRLVIDDSVYGNGDGIPQSNERLVIRPYVKNYGAGRLDQLLIQLEDPAPGVQIHSGMALLLGMDSLAEATYISGELSLTLDDITMAEPARLTFVDNYGRAFSQTLEFNPPAAPPLPAADATLAIDAIALRWDPEGTGRTLGYHVYRAEDPGGPFVRANQDLLRGISYFEDRPLDQLSMYWYRVSAVDTFFVEGPASPVVEQGTMPAEIENFPLSFGTMTSSHLAVGDVTGDGRKEIVLAADEIYVWRDDGTELLDGDDDPQTTGPFTNIGGAFSPAGVILARMDGGPELQIIASLAAPAPAIHVYRADGTMMPGWPRALLGGSSNWNWATPAVGDVTGDGFMEVVVNDLQGRTYVWRHDGTELTDGDDDPNTDGVFVVRQEGWGLSSPALYDLDGDGAREIIFGTRYDDNNTLLAYKSDGSQAPGFPYNTGTARIICSPAIADLDGNGTKEIVFFASNRRLYVLRANGTILPGFPLFHPGNHGSGAGPSPAVGDFTGDGLLEIVWPLNGTTGLDLLLVDITGSILAGWPVTLSSPSEGSPVVGDITGDGVPNIIMPTENGTIYAFNADGSPVAGFPIRLSGPCRTAPVICDLNGDGMVNVVYGSGDMLLHAWSMPYEHRAGLVPWPTFQGNNQRTGEARIVSLTSVSDPEVPTAFTVLPPYPNPFNPATTIRLYVTPESGSVLDVAIFDLRGRRMRQLFAGHSEPGWRQLTWDGCDDGGRRMGSGVYFVQARQADRTQTYKIALVK